MMTSDRNSAASARPERSRRLAWGTALALPLILVACSSTPDWAKPTVWWDSVTGDDESTAADAGTTDEAAKAPADQPYPKLSETPDRLVPTTTSDERAEVSRELAADRENARYTDQQLRASGAGTESTAASAADTTTAAASTAPAAADSTQQATTAVKPPAPEPAQTSTLADAGSSAGATSSTTGATTGYDTDPGRPMSVPSIVQRSPSDSRSSSRIEELTRPPSAQSATTSSATASSAAAPAQAAPAPASTAAAAPAAAPAPQTVAAAAAPAPAATRPPAPAATAAERAPAAVQQVASEIPVTQDQSTLAQIFAANVVAQYARSYPEARQTAFQSSGAPQIREWEAQVPPIVRDTYNAALQQSAVVQPAAGPTEGVVLAPVSRRAVVHFGHGSSGLNSEARKTVREFAVIAKQELGFIRVVGHASQRTGDMPFSRHKAVNFNVSIDRANAVARELRRRGVAAERILIEARGSQQPLYFEFMPNGEAQNRRVELFLQ